MAPSRARKGFAALPLGSAAARAALERARRGARALAHASVEPPLGIRSEV